MMTLAGLPHFTSGPVVKGFGRGSKELGFPTANFPEEVVDGLPATIGTGIYFGWAQVRGRIYKMVISIGMNPFYKNQSKSMETHIMHQFDEDFYGETLRIGIAGYLRPEQNFDNLDELIAAIRLDICNANELLDREEFKSLQKHAYFKP